MKVLVLYKRTLGLAWGFRAESLRVLEVSFKFRVRPRGCRAEAFKFCRVLLLLFSSRG